MNDEFEHEGRRNVAIVAAVLIVGMGMVAAMFWVVKSMAPPSVVLSAVSTPTDAASTTAATATPVPATTSFTPPAPTWVDATTLNLPPAAQPTLTDPVPGETADPDPDAPVASTTPPPQSTPPQPTSGASTQPPQPPQPTQPAQPPRATVSNVNLTCSKNGGSKIAARLTFTTTAQVTVAISAGGNVDRKQVGAGDASVEASGKGPAFCAAVVGGQPVGPIPAG
ncbi:hypothetical protein [Lapillicoccus sp.]|uniref:hypothetical protein n=1 Tax=Lapillicoccus sp. TaxID=1909287 RepID=UPI00326685A4